MVANNMTCISISALYILVVKRVMDYRELDYPSRTHVIRKKLLHHLDRDDILEHIKNRKCEGSTFQLQEFSHKNCGQIKKLVGIGQ